MDMLLGKKRCDYFTSITTALEQYDLEEIKKYYSSIFAISNLTLSGTIGKSRHVLYDLMYDNMRTARQCLLLHLSQLSETDYFDSPPSDVVLGFALDKPSKIYTGLSPSNGQILTNVIVLIRADIVMLAQTIRRYFEDDVTMMNTFAFMTFPALFCYFTTDEYCKLGSELIYQFLLLPRDVDVHLADSMLSSFFFCAFGFNCNLLNYFSSQIMANVYKPKDKFFKFIVECIRKASPMLSQHHKEILMIFFKIAPARCLNFLLSGFLQKSFDMFFKGGAIKAPFKETTKQMKVFFEENKNASTTERGRAIFEAFTKMGTIEKAIPRLPSNNELAVSPMIISFIDVYLIIELIEGEKRFQTTSFEFILKEKMNLYTKGYAPLTFDYNFCTDKVKDSSMENAPKELIDIWNCVKYWSKIKMTEPFLFLEKIKCDLKTVKFAYLSEIRICENTVNDISRLLDIKDMIAVNKRFKDNTVQLVDALLFNHCKYIIDHYGRSSKEITGQFSSNIIGKHIGEFVQKFFTQQKVHPTIAYKMFITILNFFIVEPDKELKGIISRFKEFIRLQSKKLIQEIEDYPKEKKEIEKICFNLISASSQPIGSQYDLLLQLAKDIKVIDDQYKERTKEQSNYIFFFSYSIVAINSPDFLTTFILCEKVIQLYDVFYDHWPKHLQKAQRMLSGGIKSFIKFENDLIEKVFTYDFQ